MRTLWNWPNTILKQDVSIRRYQASACEACSSVAAGLQNRLMKTVRQLRTKVRVRSS